MEAIIAIVISILALTFSVFTFYWISIRRKQSLQLIRIQSFGSMAPEFVLVNGGNHEILITRLMCSFSNKNETSWQYLKQQINNNESDSFLLPSNKSYHCRVNFLEPLNKEFFRDGKEEVLGSAPVFTKNMKIDVDWIETSGREYTNSIYFNTYSFSKDGNVFLSKPFSDKKKYDLYDI